MKVTLVLMAWFKLLPLPQMICGTLNKVHNLLEEYVFPHK